MLEAGKYESVHKLFETMQRNGLALKALTYKGGIYRGNWSTIYLPNFIIILTQVSIFTDLSGVVLVKAFWREGRIEDAVMAVRDMEQRGIVGAACLYYELACCLCKNGLWKDAMLEVCCSYAQNCRNVHGR